MGTSYNPKIVTDGLVLNLDPANVKSYPANQDPFVNNVSLMLSMNGANNSTTFTDSSQNALAVTVVGNAQISTTQSKYGGASAYFGGSTDRITAVTTNSTFTGDFTWECWFYPTSDTNTYKALFSAGSETTGRYILLQYGSNIVVDLYAVSQNINVYCGITANSGWHHVALVRSGTTVTLYYDGVSKATATRSGTVGNTNGFFCGNNSAGTNPYNGFIDDLRITKAARYTANFTPPAGPLPLPGRITDLTRNKAIGSFLNTPTYSSTNGGCIVFNGTNQYITSSINSLLSNNATINIWIYTTQTESQFINYAVSLGNGATPNFSVWIGGTYSDSFVASKSIGIFINNNSSLVSSAVANSFTTTDYNKWNNICCTYDSILGGKIYKNGILLSMFSNTAIGTINSQNTLNIARRIDSNYYFNSSISNIQIYNKTLTTSEVFQNYTATKGRFR